MANYTHRRDHRYLSRVYKCPSTAKAVRVPAECMAFIEAEMQRRGSKNFSDFIRSLVYAEMERQQWHD